MLPSCDVGVGGGAAGSHRRQNRSPLFPSTSSGWEKKESRRRQNCNGLACCTCGRACTLARTSAGTSPSTSISATAEASGEHLGNADWSVCYQSRVGPLRWIGPSTEAEIRRAGAQKTNVVLYPISFVSEHSETLVELDIDYRHLARDAGVPSYIRVPTVGTHPLFIHGLVNLVKAALWSTTS